MLDFIKEINSNYAGVLSLLSSLAMIVVTVIYVAQTKRQANYAKKSAELVAEQIKTDKQPCIVPNVTNSHGSAFDASDYTRIQLGFEVELKNVGDAPAINIYTFAELELQFTSDADGKKALLSAALLPRFVQALSGGEKEIVDIHFETSEVIALAKELAKADKMNIERIEKDPSQHPYNGANLIVHVLFKNIMGQWSESTISYEIAWLVKTIASCQKKKNDFQECYSSPEEIQEGDNFKAVLIAQHWAPFSFKMTTDDYAKSLLRRISEDSPLHDHLINS